MGKIKMQVIQIEEISIKDVPVKERPPIKFEVLKDGKTINAKIPQALIDRLFTLNNGNTELYLKGKSTPIIVKGSSQKIMTNFFEKNKRLFRQAEWAEKKQVNMPEELIGSLTEITVLMKNGKYEKATKVYRRGTNEYIIVCGSVLDILEKMCTTIKFS